MRGRQVLYTRTRWTWSTYKRAQTTKPQNPCNSVLSQISGTAVGTVVNISIDCLEDSAGHERNLGLMSRQQPNGGRKEGCQLTMNCGNTMARL